MPTPVTHAYFAVAAGGTALGRRMSRRAGVVLAVCGALPDLDAIGFRFGVPYESLWGHRGITHSLAFSAWLAFPAALLAFPGHRVLRRGFWGLWLLLFLVTALHGVLDAMTSGGLGVAFLAPFSESRHFLPFRPIVVSPIGIRAFFSSWGLDVAVSEFLWVWLPMSVLWLASWAVRPNRKGNTIDPARDRDESG